jgi:hypothetical protein
LRRIELAACDAGEKVHTDRANQRLGDASVISGFGPRLASARATATPVAVAPTLVARSQVSSSVRAI